MPLIGMPQGNYLVFRVLRSGRRVLLRGRRMVIGGRRGLVTVFSRANGFKGGVYGQ
mgnify:CR=1 FL=1